MSLAGRDASFEACFRAHYPDVLAYALRRVGGRQAAEDVAAETFAVAWRRRDSLPRDPVPWLFGIARNVLRNEQRAERRLGRLRARLARDVPLRVARDPADAHSERTAILAALKELPEPDRELLRLAAWEGLDAQQAARALGCSRAAVAVRLHRARRRLAVALRATEPSSQHADTGRHRRPVRDPGV